MRGKTVRAWMLGSAVVILVVSCWISFRTTDYKQDIIEGLVVEGTADGKTVELAFWQDESDGKYYLFLPSWFQGQSGEFVLHYSDRMGKIKIDGEALSDGSLWKEDGLETEHRLEIQDIFGDTLLDTSLQVLASEKLPSIFVAVEEKNGILWEEEFANKQYLETGFLEMRDTDGELLYQGELEEFKVRGNLTATYGKKPFTFSFEEPISVLGMDAACKWNLLANATDGSYIRNKIIRDLAYESIDAYEPEGEFAELFLNGEYQGLYLLTEAVEIGENRLEISAEENWFIEMELNFRAREDATSMITERGQIFIVHTETGISDAEKERILARLNDIESALFADDGISTISGKSLEQLIDLESFAEAWLVEELSGDHDIGITSQFAYALKEEDSIWYSGPVWDFDGIMTNVNTPMYGVPEALTGVIEMSRPDDNPNQNRWLAAMWRHPQFQEIVKEKYKSVFRDNYERILEQRIGGYAAQIRRSAVLDAFRWHDDRLGWWFVVPEGLEVPTQGTYDSFDTLDFSIDIVKDFMSRKLAFLDKLWIDDREFCVVEVRNSATFLDQGYNQTLYYWVEKGTPIENLPHYENEEYRFEGYYDKDSGELIADGFVIEYDRILEGRWTWREETE